MSEAALGVGIAIRVDADTVALGVVGCVHDDATVDGLLYVQGAAVQSFSRQLVGDAESDVIGSAWSPASGLT